MSTIEEKVLSMKFDNKQFESGVATTLSSLSNLKRGLDMSGQTKGFNDISDAANKVNFNGMSSGLETVRVRFSALQVTAVTALTNIVTSAVNAGKNIISSLTLDPIMDGFHEYETQMNSIQTVLANTSGAGTTLDQVNAALQELNTYSDKTIYNFTEMTRNIGTFTAAGVDLNTSVSAIKGIANLAAVSGSSSEQASSAMYQLSQALAAGTVKLQDWNSVVYAGMGGKVFQDSLMETARVHGIAIDDMVKSEGSFRETLKNGWLTSSILTETLSKFTGDLNADQLKTMGYTDEQIAGILKMGDMANKAATEIKTVSQLMGTLKEAVGSGWAQTWQIVFGNFTEAKELFTNVGQVLSGMIINQAQARNDMLQGWKDLGGRTVLIEGIKNAFDGVMGVVKAVGDAFRQIFPATTSAQLLSLTQGFTNLTSYLKLSDTTLANLSSTFKGVFAILDIGKQIFVALASGIATIITGSSNLGSSILSATASFGEWLTALDNVIKSSGIINTVIQALAGNIRNAFNGTGNTLQYFGTQFAAMRDAVVKEINFDPWVSFSGVLSNIGKTVELICNKISELQGKLSDLLTNFGQKFNGVDIGGSVAKVYQGLSSLLVGQADEVKKSDDTMQSSFTTSMNNFVKNIGAISMGAIGLAMAKFISSIANFIKNKNGVGSLFETLEKTISSGMGSVTKTLDSVRGCLQQYQNQLKAEVLIKIATAVGILAASIAVVSLIDSGKLATSLAAIGGLFAQLLVATKIFGMIGEFKLSAIKSAIVMTTMSTAILILANAMRVIGQLDITQTITSLSAILALMGMMTLSMKVLSTNSGTFTKGALSIIAFAEAIKILGKAVKEIGELDWETIKKGLMGLAGVMTELSLFLNKTNPSLGLKTAASILILSAAMNAMGKALESIGSMDWESIKKGLMGMGGILLEVAAFDKLTTNAKNMISTSVSLGIISVAMNNMGKALNGIGNMDWETIKKGLMGIGGVLLEVAGFDKLTSNTKNLLASSASLVIVAEALKKMYTPLSDIGALDWETIKKGLMGMGGALLEVSLFSKFSSGIEGSVKAAISLGIAVGALSILAKDLQVFGSLNWDEISKGLVGMGGALTEIVLTMSMLSSNAPINGLALIEICTALNILTKAFTGFSGLSWDGIAKGIVAMAAALGSISLAMKLIPEDSIWTALGLTGIATALVTMSQAMNTLSGLSWEGIAKGIVAIGGSLLVLAGGIKLMEGSLSGVAALVVAALALNLLVPPILQLSTITWDGLLVSLAALAGTIGVLGIAAALLTPVIPEMYALSGALVILGLAVVGIGAGISLATLGLQQLSQAFLNLDGTTQQGAANVATAMTAMVTGIANGIPTIITKIGEGITLAVQNLTNAIPTFVDFVLKAIVAMSEAIVTNAPKIIGNVLKTLSSVLDELIKWIPTISQQVVDIILALLKVLADNVGKFVTAGTNIIVGFLKGISDNLPNVIDAAFKVIISFINGLADAIRGNSNAIADACANLIDAVIDGLGTLADKMLKVGENAVQGFINGLVSMPGKIWDAGCALGQKALDAAKRALDEHSPSKEMNQVGVYAGQGLVNGLVAMGSKVADASYNMGRGALNSMSKAISGITDTVNDNIDAQPVITPVMDLTNIQNGSKQIYGMMDGLGNYGIDGSVNAVDSTAKSISSRQLLNNNPDINTSKSNTIDSKTVTKQPVALQLVLQNGRAIAEYLVDDIDSLMGSKNIIAGRSVGI